MALLTWVLSLVLCRCRAALSSTGTFHRVWGAHGRCGMGRGALSGLCMAAATVRLSNAGCSPAAQVVLEGGERIDYGVCVWSTGNATRPIVQVPTISKACISLWEIMTGIDHHLESACNGVSGQTPSAAVPSVCTLM